MAVKRAEYICPSFVNNGRESTSSAVYTRREIRTDRRPRVNWFAHRAPRNAQLALTPAKQGRRHVTGERHGRLLVDKSVLRKRSPTLSAAARIRTPRQARCRVIRAPFNTSPRNASALPRARRQRCCGGAAWRGGSPIQVRHVTRAANR